MVLEQTSIGLLSRKIKAPKIAAVLIIPRLRRLIDHPQVHIMRSWRRHARHLEKSKGHGFKESVLAAASIIAMLDARSKVQIVPFHFVGLAVFVRRREFPAAVEFELPH